MYAKPALCLLPFCTALAAAQVEPVWTRRLPAASPSARVDHAVVFDAARQRLVMFGGSDLARGYLDETWEWDGATWTERLPANRPTPRAFHGMVYDPPRARVLLYGGETFGGALLGDIWSWNGSDWTRLRCAAPTPRKRHAMACSSGGDILVFGGEDATGPLGDTWMCSGGGFMELAPVHAPSARLGSQIAWDGRRAEFVLFGGLAATATDDTWAWSGSDWVPRAPAVHPFARFEHAMAFDPTTDRVVLYGGLGWPDTWEWDGATWAETTTANLPTAVVGIARGLARDPARARTVLVGGELTRPLAETWQYYRGVPAAAVSYGSGCPGSSTNALTLAPEDAPPPKLAWIGSAVVQRVSHGPMFSSGAILIGFGAIGPIDLAPIGMPGCALHVDPFVAPTLPIRFGVGTLATTIADDPTLPGRVFHSQAVVIDAGANPLGVTTSNGVAWTIGG